MDLSHPIWQEAEGGYRVPYDASVPLKELERTTEPLVIRRIWKELWNELHHQGDVGLASYLALSQLVRIGRAKGLFDWNLVGLCCVIEQQRHLGKNPELPVEFQRYYEAGLNALKEFVQEHIRSDLDDPTFIASLSALATCSGRVKLGKAILDLEDPGTLEEFLDQF